MIPKLYSNLIIISLLLTGISKTYAGEYLPGQTYSDTWYYSWTTCPSPAGTAELDVTTDLPGGITFSPGTFTIPATPGYFYPFTVTFTTPATPGIYFYEITDLISGSVSVHDVIVTNTPTPNLIHTFTVPVNQVKDTTISITNTPFLLGNGCSMASETHDYHVTTYPSNPVLTVLNPVFSVAPNNTNSYTYHLFSTTPDTISFVRQLTTDGGQPSFRRVDVIFTCVAPNATVTAAGPTTFCDGQSVTLNAPVAANRIYQWKKGGTNIPGATSSSFTASDSGTYKVKVTNTISGCTKVTSTGTSVTVKPLPSTTITAGSATTFCDGLSVTLNAVAAANRTYQWKRNGVNISGATSASHIAFIQGTYKVKVTNTVSGCSKTTGTGKVVNVNPLPVAQITPAGTISFCAGQSALLTATNSFGYTFKWKRNNVLIAGAVSDTLTVTQAGKYKVVVTNAFFCQNSSLNDTVVIPCRKGMPYENAFDLSVNPNPAINQVVVEFNSDDAECILEINNLIGGRVVSKTIYAGEKGKFSEELDVTGLPAGLYVVNVISERGTQQAKKFVKE